MSFHGEWDTCGHCGGTGDDPDVPWDVLGCPFCEGGEIQDLCPNCGCGDCNCEDWEIDQALDEEEQAAFERCGK